MNINAPMWSIRVQLFSSRRVLHKYVSIKKKNPAHPNFTKNKTR